MPRETWTDERLDDLNKRVDDGFRETREEIRDTRQGLRQEIRDTRKELNGRLDRLQLVLLGGLLTVIVSIFADRL